MATQVQIRGAANAAQSIRTLVGRELDINTTANRLNVHNGSLAGGIPHLTGYDNQNNQFTYASASGTNALTATLPLAPTSYTTGQIFWLKLANTNTGSVTININSLGAKTLRKYYNNAQANIAAGDLSSGQIIGIIYDGTYFQLLAGSGAEFASNAWIPSGVTSYTAANCQYVEYGDSVTVSFQVITGGTTIGNLPFAPIAQVSCAIRYSFAGRGIDNGYDFARIDSGTTTLSMNMGAGGFTARGQITYIKG